MGIKYKANENFFKFWSKNMAYTLGYIYADGNLIDSPYMRGKYVKITSTDLDSLERVKKWLDSEHIITKVKNSDIRRKDCYILRIGSHKIYNDLLKLGLHPNKSLTIKLPAIQKQYFSHFVRGYFDGDGCIYFEKRTGKKEQLIIKRIRTIFTGGSKVFLDKMNNNFKKMSILNGRIYPSKRSFQAVYNTKDSIKIFKLMYGNTGINSFFMRKFKTFEDYFRVRPQAMDATIARILTHHNTGHVVK